MPQKYGFVATAESHLEGSQLNRAYKVIRKQMHCDAAFAQARRNETGKGTHGGAVLQWKKHLDTVSMAPHLSGKSPIRGVGRDWVGIIWRTLLQSILIIVVYMKDSIGYTGENIEKFVDMGICVRHYRMPYIMIGDWSMEPVDLPQNWLRKIGGMVLTPLGLSGTCTLGPPKMYDYVIHSSDLQGALELYPDLYSSTRPHVSLILQMLRRPRKLLARSLVAPKEFPIIEYIQQEKEKANKKEN